MLTHQRYDWTKQQSNALITCNSSYTGNKKPNARLCFYSRRASFFAASRLLISSSDSDSVTVRVFLRRFCNGGRRIEALLPGTMLFIQVLNPHNRVRQGELHAPSHLRLKSYLYDIS